jgi:hypothetical protein
MGKVGSTSIENGLKENGIHLHNFFFENIPCHCKYPRKPYIKWFEKFKLFIIRLAIKRRKRVKMISAVRDPLDRNISMFFQDLHHYLNAYDFKHSTAKKEQDKLLLNKCFDEIFYHEYPCNWFDDELKRLTKIDIYNYPFNKSDGYVIIKSGKFEILILDCKKINSSSDIINKFIEHPIDLINSNVGGDKWYGPIYKVFKETYKPTEYYKNKIYNSKFSKHFGFERTF